MSKYSRRTLSIIGLWCLPLLALGNQAVLDIHINVGQVKTIDSSFLSVKSFNSTSTFNFNSQVFSQDYSDSVVLQIYNHDSIEHVISVEPFVQNFKINPQQMNSVLVLNMIKGDYRIRDVNETQAYLGLSGVIHVKRSSALSHYFWNLKEFQSDYNKAIEIGQTVSFTTYSPDYFMINGKSFPEIEKDSEAKIRGNVGDTLRLTMLNSGQSIHPIHFHGFHFKVLYSSHFQEAIDREKDTYGLWSGEIVILEIVPDKTGEYPVHSHNLVSVSANNIYPNGMFTTMVIAE
jgi:hypothetical protein